MPIHGPNPQSAKLDDSVTYTWSDGTTFTGSLRLGLVVPEYGGTTDAPFITLAAQTPAIRIPLNTFFQITNGVANTQTKALYNSSLRPPNSQYVAWWYDSTGTLIAGPSAQFTISSSPFSPPAVTLTAPTVGSTIPPSEV